MTGIKNEREKPTLHSQQQVRDFLETAEGKTFIKKQSKRAYFITFPLFVTPIILALLISKHSNINYLHPKRDLVFICLSGGFFLAYASVRALFDQIVLIGLNSKLGLSKEEQIPLPFQSLKTRIIAGLSVLMICIGIIEELVS